MGISSNRHPFNLNPKTRGDSQIMKKILDGSPLYNFIPLIFLAILLYLGYLIMKDFFLTLTWAVIIAYVVWPAYSWLKKLLKDRETLSAGVMTAFIAIVITSIVSWLAAMLQNEITVAYQVLVDMFVQGDFQLPGAIRNIPWLGEYLQDGLDTLVDDRNNLVSQLLALARLWFGQFGQFLGGVGRNVMQLVFVLVTVFFCFRDGQKVSMQLHQGLARFMGKYRQFYFQAAGDTTKGVVYGIVVAALGQGVTAGIGYAVAGVQAPALFGMVTFILAMIPWGAMSVWIPIGISLLVSGEIWAGIGLLAWGLMVVSVVDNIIRPFVISGASQVPFLVVMFGVFGGLTSFGIIGLFIGPVILSVLLAVWQVWVKLQDENQVRASP